jgi:hypothetical protein
MQSRTLVGAALIGAALLFGLPGTSRPQDTPEWPSEQEERLKKLDSELLDVQRLRFVALFGDNGGNQEEAQRLAERLREIQQERFEMLRATGQM